MKRYNVVLSTSFEVEAEDEDAAMAAAEERIEDDYCELNASDLDMVVEEATPAKV